MGIDLLKIENLGIEKVVKRGTAELLEQDGDGIFVYDTVSRSHMLSSANAETAKQWILKHADKGYTAFSAVGKDIAGFVAERYTFSDSIVCHQFAYFGEAPELPKSELKIRQAEPKDTEFILMHYGTLSEEEISTIISRGKLFLGELDGKPAGFIGEHLEGSMGLLFVLPEYRNRGVATSLETFLVRETVKEGYIPFGQVVVGNEKSLNLQKKLGMKEGSEYVYWFF